MQLVLDRLVLGHPEPADGRSDPSRSARGQDGRRCAAAARHAGRWVPGRGSSPSPAPSAWSPAARSRTGRGQRRAGLVTWWSRSRSTMGADGITVHMLLPGPMDTPACAGSPSRSPTNAAWLRRGVGGVRRQGASRPRSSGRDARVGLERLLSSGAGILQGTVPHLDGVARARPTTMSSARAGEARKWSSRGVSAPVVPGV